MTSQQTQAEQNKTLIRRLFEEGMNQNTPATIDALIAPNYVNHNLPSPTPGRAGFRQVVDLFRTAFPDFHVTLEDAFAEGDKVGTRGYFTGTHKGDFQGISPTGKPVKVTYIDLWRIENGQFVENWVQMDMLGLLQQLGAVPAPEQARI